MLSRLLPVFLVLIPPGANPAKEGKTPARVPAFTEDIRPLLQAKCARCHGARVKRAGLDLRTLAGVLKGGESGPAAVPGRPDQSPLDEKVHAGAMPPAKKDRLSAAGVDSVRRWIAAGAGGAGPQSPAAVR